MTDCKECGKQFQPHNNRHQFCSLTCLRQVITKRQEKSRKQPAKYKTTIHPFEEQFGANNRRELRTRFTKWIHSGTTSPAKIIQLVTSDITEKQPKTPTETYLAHLITTKTAQCIAYIEHLTTEIKQWNR